jgi:hypothetical protein
LRSNGITIDARFLRIFNDCAITAQLLRDGFSMASQSLVNRFAIEAQSLLIATQWLRTWLRDDFAITTQSLGDHYAMALHSLHDPYKLAWQLSITIALQSLHDPYKFALHSSALTARSLHDSLAMASQSLVNRFAIEAQSLFNGFLKAT